MTPTDLDRISELERSLDLPADWPTLEACGFRGIGSKWWANETSLSDSNAFSLALTGYETRVLRRMLKWVGGRTMDEPSKWAFLYGELYQTIMSGTDTAATILKIYESMSREQGATP